MTSQSIWEKRHRYGITVSASTTGNGSTEAAKGSDYSDMLYPSCWRSKKDQIETLI